MRGNSHYLYFQIYKDLIARIKAGTLSAGDKIEGEVELAAKYRVNRATVRKALAYLQAMNLIYRIKKGGTFLNGKQKLGMQYKIVPTVLPFTENLHKEIVSGIQVLAISSNCFSPIYDSLGNYEHEREILLGLLDIGVDALIIYPCVGMRNINILYKFKARNIPIIFLDRAMPGFDAPLVTSNNAQGMSLAVQHLIDNDHKNIGFFAINKNGILPEHERLRGYFETMTANGIPVQDEFVIYFDDLANRLTLYTPKRQDQYYQSVIQTAFDNFWAMQNRPTAVAFINDFLAINFIKDAVRRGKRVPGDVSVFGFDNVEMCLDVTPMLSTVRQDFYRMGNTAIKLALDLCEGKTVKSLTLVDTELVLRDSVSPLSPSSFTKNAE